jgi:tail fiber protein gp53
MPFVSVPNSGQSLGATRDQIRNNILDIKNSLAVNHEDLDNGADTGKHIMTNFLQISNVAQKPTTSATEVALYNDSSVTGQIWICPPNTTQGDLAVQLTAGDITDANFGEDNAITNGDGGWTFLPGNLLLQYGIVPAASADTVLVTFPIAFAAGTLPFTIQLTQITDGNSTTIRTAVNENYTRTSFTIEQSNTSHLKFVSWFAIGRAP